MQNRTGHGGGGYSSSTMSSSYTPLPSQQHQDMYPDERFSQYKAYEKRSIDCMERLLDVAIDSQNMLREYLERGHGDSRGHLTQDHFGDADEDDGVATTAATQAAVNALMPDVFRSGSNKAILNFEITSDKASQYLQKFARTVSDTWLSDYKTGHETDLTDCNIYSRKVSTLAMMIISTSLTKIGYPSEHVSAGKVAALIKKLVKQSRWRAKQDRAVKTEAPLDDTDRASSETTSSQVSPRNHERETSDARLREDVVIGSSDSDEDYDEEGEKFSDFDGAEVLSQRSSTAPERLPHYLSISEVLQLLLLQTDRGQSLLGRRKMQKLQPSVVLPPLPNDRRQRPLSSTTSPRRSHLQLFLVKRRRKEQLRYDTY
jgi:hypothetical protein